MDDFLNKSAGLVNLRDLAQYLAEVKVVKITKSFVYVYKKTPDKIFVAKIAHKNVAKNAKDLVDPPPDEWKPEAEIKDPHTYTSPVDATDLATGGKAVVHPDPSEGGGMQGATWTGKKSQKGAQKILPKQENMVPIYHNTDKHVWFWIGTQAMATLIKVTHLQVKKYVGKAIWPDSPGVAFAGVIDPKAYKGPADIHPADSVKAPEPSGPVGAVELPDAPSQFDPEPEAPAATPVAAMKPASFAQPYGMDPSPPKGTITITPVMMKELPAPGKLEYPIPPNFVRNAEGWMKRQSGDGGVLHGLPGKWYGYDGVGRDAIFTMSGSVIANDAETVLFSAFMNDVKKGSKWEDNIAPTFAKLLPPSGFRPSDLKKTTAVLGMYNLKPAVAYPAEGYLEIISTKEKIQYTSDAAKIFDEPEDEDDDPMSAMEYPTPPNFEPLSGNKGPKPKALGQLTVLGISGTWHGYKGPVIAIFTSKGFVYPVGGNTPIFNCQIQGIPKGKVWPEAKLAGFELPKSLKMSEFHYGGQADTSLRLGVWGGDQPVTVNAETGSIEVIETGELLWTPDDKEPDSGSSDFPWAIPPNFVIEPNIGKVIGNYGPGKGLFGYWYAGQKYGAVYTVDGKILNSVNDKQLWGVGEFDLKKGQTDWPEIEKLGGEYFPVSFVPSSKEPESGSYLGVWKGAGHDPANPKAAYWNPKTGQVFSAVNGAVYYDVKASTPKKGGKPVPVMEWPHPPNFIPAGPAGGPYPLEKVKAFKGKKKVFQAVKGVWKTKQDVEAFQDGETGDIRSMYGVVLWSAKMHNAEHGTKTFPVPAEFAAAPAGFAISQFSYTYTQWGVGYAYLGMYKDPSTGAAAVPAYWSKEKNKIVAANDYNNVLFGTPHEVDDDSGSSYNEPAPAKTIVTKSKEMTADDIYAATKPAVSSIPSFDQLKLIGSGKEQGLGGAGYKEVFQDASGNKYIWKPAWPKSGKTSEPFRAMAQSLFSSVATKVRPDHIPIETRKLGDVVGTIQPMLELGDPATLGATPPKDLTDVQKLDIASEHILDWVLSQHDTHSNNIVRTKEGRLLSVDKEQGFKYFPKDELSINYHPNAMYGEQEPYYNKFWRDWSQKKFEFDPKLMASAVEKVATFDSLAYSKQLEAYANANPFLNTAVKKANFVNAALTRRLNVRAEFEQFITDAYTARTGKEGDFTFEFGWVTDDQQADVKYKEVKFSAKELAADSGIKYEGSVPYFFKNEDGTYDESKKLLKVPNTGAKIGEKTVSEQKLLDMLSELEIVPIPWPDGNIVQTGSTYNIVIVPAADFEKAQLVKKVPVGESYQHTLSQPKYWPTTLDEKPAEVNTEILNDMEGTTLGVTGKRVALDGGLVEGQVASVRKYKDTEGFYYMVTTKLRKKHWEALSNSGKLDSVKFSFPIAVYDEKTDAFMSTGSFSDSCAAKHAVVGDVDGYIVTDTSKYAYMGSLYLKVRSSSVKGALEKWLKAVAPDMADQILAVPTPEDLELMKLRRVLWAVAPSAADKLDKTAMTKGDLENKLAGYGVDEKFLREVELTEVYPGYQSHVRPGMWKTLANGKLKFMFNGITSQEAMLSIIKSGLMGIHERNLAGMPKFGASYASDVESGSGDGILLRPVTESGLNTMLGSHPFAGQFQAIVHPSIGDRLDSYMYLGDTFGRCRADASVWTGRKSVIEQLNAQQSSYRSSAEISFRRGITLDKILRMCCDDESTRKIAIASAISQGTTKVNGVPIEDFIVVCEKCSDVYNRYVKPLGV